MDPSGNSAGITFFVLLGFRAFARNAQPYACTFRVQSLTFEPEASAFLSTFMLARAAFYQVELQAHLYVSGIPEVFLSMIKNRWFLTIMKESSSISLLILTKIE